MANGRNKLGRKVNLSREPGGFVALPWSVLNSDAFQGLTHKSKSLLLELARQYVGDNNGRLLLSTRYLKTRGWNSADVISRAKQELLESRLVFETFKGFRPNKASWYALTWNSLDSHPDYDAGVKEGFRRGMYRDQSGESSPSRSEVSSKKQNAAAIPSGGTVGEPVVPARGIQFASSVPCGGTAQTA